MESTTDVNCSTRTASSTRGAATACTSPASSLPTSTSHNNVDLESRTSISPQSSTIHSRTTMLLLISNVVPSSLAFSPTPSPSSSQSEAVVLWGSVVGILCAVLLAVSVALVIVLRYTSSSCQKSECMKDCESFSFFMKYFIVIFMWFQNLNPIILRVEGEVIF